ALTLLLEQFKHCPEQPSNPQPKRHVYCPPKPQAFSHRSKPPQTALTWDLCKGTGMGAAVFAGVFPRTNRHFASQSLSVIPAAWLNTLLSLHSFSQVAKDFFCAKDGVGNASPKASPRQMAEHTISINRLAM